MKQFLSKRNEWCIGIGVLIAALGWCIAAGRVIYYQGDYMIGFHPLILLAIPFAGVLVLVAFLGYLLRLWRFSTMTVVSAILPVVFIFQGYWIGMWAWTRSICRYDTVNQAAIRTGPKLPELTENTVIEGINEDDALPVLKGFRWYCDHHLASPGSTFRAFRFRGITHIRIQKIRHGYRGIAFVPTTVDKQKLAKDSPFIYENELPQKDHWLIWHID